jgi:hypothetical protein
VFAVLPDLDAALVAFLRDHPSLAPLHGGRVSVRMPSGAAAALRVTSIGGFQDAPWEGFSEYQIECWGPGVDDAAYQAAHMLARTVIAAVYDMPGPVTGGRVTSAVPTLRPLESPDADTGRARYIVQVQIQVYPEA